MATIQKHARNPALGEGTPHPTGIRLHQQPTKDESGTRTRRRNGAGPDVTGNGNGNQKGNDKNGARMGKSPTGNRPTAYTGNGTGRTPRGKGTAKGGRGATSHRPPKRGGRMGTSTTAKKRKRRRRRSRESGANTDGTERGGSSKRGGNLENQRRTSCSKRPGRPGGARHLKMMSTIEEWWKDWAVKMEKGMEWRTPCKGWKHQ